MGRFTQKWTNFFQNIEQVTPCKITIEEEDELILDNDSKLELVNIFLFNLRGETNSTLDYFFIHFRDTHHQKQILTWQMIFWEQFWELLQLMKS
jgi:hypothetical protein